MRDRPPIQAQDGKDHAAAGRQIACKLAIELPVIVQPKQARKRCAAPALDVLLEKHVQEWLDFRCLSEMLHGHFAQLSELLLMASKAFLAEHAQYDILI